MLLYFKDGTSHSSRWLIIDLANVYKDGFVYRRLMFEQHVGATYSTVNVTDTVHIENSLSWTFCCFKLFPFLGPTYNYLSQKLTLSGLGSMTTPELRLLHLSCGFKVRE